MSDPSPGSVEADLRRESSGWTDGYLVRLYQDSRNGLEVQAREQAVLVEHGYQLQSSELAREGSLMVAYVLAEQADEYPTLEHSGLGAATDPDSYFARFAKPLAWVVAIGIVLLAAWLLTVSLAGS